MATLPEKEAGLELDTTATHKVSKVKSTTLQELIGLGKDLGYSGKDLQLFVAEQQDREREERKAERDARREEAERETRKDEAEREARREEAEREARKDEAERKATREEAEREARKDEAEREARREEAEREAKKEEAEREARREEAEREARREEAERRREEAVREENERKWKAEMDARQEEVRMRLQHEQRMARIQKGQELSVPFYADEDESEEIMSTGRRLPPNIPVPKYDDNVKDVSRYLELFEKVAKQNGYPQSSWSLAFRVAVAGTKLEMIASLGESFDDIKKEVLLAHGYTAEQLWKQLTTIKQGDESFRQMFATTKLGQFFKLAVKDENVTVELMTGTLIKYMVLEGCSNELRAHFLEKTLSSITCDEFQEIGSSFQEAHGRSQCSEKEVHSFASCSVEQSSTMNAWEVSAESTIAKLEKLPVSERRNFVFENHLCFNCLLPGHIGSMCRSAKRCAKCKLKHNTLLHADYRNKEGEHTKVNVVSSQVDHTEAGKNFDVLLMTAIVHVMDY